MIKFKEELFEQLVKATQPELLNEILIEKMRALGMADYVHTEDYLMYQFGLHPRELEGMTDVVSI